MRAMIRQQLIDENINDIEDINKDTYSNVELFLVTVDLTICRIYQLEEH